MKKKYRVYIVHDNRNKTLTMTFQEGSTKLGVTHDYFLDKEPSYQKAKEQLEKMAISTITAYDVLGAKKYDEIINKNGMEKMSASERQALFSTITAKHPKGLMPEIIYKEI